MVLLIILVLSVQPVSAGFFEDIFDKITGNGIMDHCYERIEWVLYNA